MASISVAMAVYNGETYLPEQLDSILSQLEPQDFLRPVSRRHMAADSVL